MLLPIILWIVISSSILSFTIIQVSQKYIEDEIIQYVSNTHSEVGSQIELVLNQLSLFASNILSNKSVHKILKSDIKPYEKKSQIKIILDELGYDESLIGDIKFFTLDGEVIEYSTSYISIPVPETSELEKYQKERYIWQWGNLVQDSKGHFYLPYVVKLYNMGLQDFSGFAILYIKESMLYDLCTNITPEDSTTYILSEGDYVVSHTKNQYIGYKVLEAKNYAHITSFDSRKRNSVDAYTIINITNLDSYIDRFHLNWLLVTEIPSNVLFSDLAKIKIYIVIFTVFMMLFVSLLVIRLSKTLSKSIVNFNKRIQDYIQLDIQHNINGPRIKNEIVELESAYDALINRIQILIEKNSDEKEKQRDLELQALQAQINPHFLYNTLDAVAWMAKMKEQVDIVDIIIALARFFRLSLHNGDKYITIEEELDIARSYVFIEQIRFPNKIKLSIDVDEEILDDTILKLTLQPFIENAIKHGISKKKGVGTITIRGRQIGSHIEFDIWDDGVGNDNINAFYQPKKMLSGGYGINNVKERILLEYGHEATISIESSRETGTKIQIILPLT